MARELMPEERRIAAQMTKAHIATARYVKRTRERPALGFEAFHELVDLGVVEDLGGGYARLTPIGRAVLRSVPFPTQEPQERQNEVSGRRPA